MVDVNPNAEMLGILENIVTQLCTLIFLQYGQLILHSLCNVKAFSLFLILSSKIIDERSRFKNVS